MGKRTYANVAAMPASTWHYLKMNAANIEIDTALDNTSVFELKLAGDATKHDGAFKRAMALAQSEWEKTHDTDEPPLTDYSEKQAEKLDSTAQSHYQIQADKIELARDLNTAFETGMGKKMGAQLRDESCDVLSIAVKKGASGSVKLAINAIESKVNLCAFDFVAQQQSELEIDICVDSPLPGTGWTATTARVFAGRGAHIVIRRVQTVDDTYSDIDDLGLFLADGATVEVYQSVLGGAKTYTALAADLRGDGAKAKVYAHYLGHGQQAHDFNYILRHHGKRSESTLNTNGVLSDKSSKCLRGTIDLIRGCKGAVGAEKDTVLLTDEGATNKTVPTILCNEEDVMGTHGATIGHISADQLFYLATRGLSEKQAEEMFVSASLEQAYIEAFDKATKASVVRLGSQLVDDFEEVVFE